MHRILTHKSSLAGVVLAGLTMLIPASALASPTATILDSTGGAVLDIRVDALGASPSAISEGDSSAWTLSLSINGGHQGESFTAADFYFGSGDGRTNHETWAGTGTSLLSVSSLFTYADAGNYYGSVGGTFTTTWIETTPIYSWVEIPHYEYVYTYYDGMTQAPDGSTPPAGTVKTATWTQVGTWTVQVQTGQQSTTRFADYTLNYFATDGWGPGVAIWDLVPHTALLPIYCDGTNGTYGTVCSYQNTTWYSNEIVGFDPSPGWEALTVTEEGNAVPEPHSWPLTLLGLFLMGVFARRRNLNRMFWLRNYPTVGPSGGWVV